MSTIITNEDIQKGDKIKVTYNNSDVEYSRTGVAFNQNFDGDWDTAKGVFLTFNTRNNQVIELLERPKTAEEILKERRDKLAVDFSWADYANVSGSMQQAIDRIIFLEDEKEALVN